MVANDNRIVQVFDRRLLRLFWERNVENIIKTNFLNKHIAGHFIERLRQTKALSFSNILILGRYSESLKEYFLQENPQANIYFGHFSLPYLSSFRSDNMVILDSENLPFKEKSFDLVVSILDLHNVNDLPGSLVQIRRILQDEGLFLASLLGGETFTELREACLAVDNEFNSTSPKVAPFLHIKTAGELLQRAKFLMPIVDQEVLTLDYSSVDNFLLDIKNMGEGNILSLKTKNLMSKKRLNLIKEKYASLFEENGHIPASIELLNLTAFKN